MKIAIYGISCAGKDTFISEVIKRFPDFTHIKGSTRLNEISQKIIFINLKIIKELRSRSRNR